MCVCTERQTKLRISLNHILEKCTMYLISRACSEQRLQLKCGAEHANMQIIIKKNELQHTSRSLPECGANSSKQYIIPLSIIMSVIKCVRTAFCVHATTVSCFGLNNRHPNIVKVPYQIFSSLFLLLSIWSVDHFVDLNLSAFFRFRTVVYECRFVCVCVCTI